MENNTTETLTDLVSRVAVALETAVVEHGPEAVDLVLTVYQIDAVKSLLLSFLLLLPLLWVKKVQQWLKDVEEVEKGLGCVIGIFMFVGYFLVNLTGSTLFSPVHWIAAFGNPELLIATRALEAAGAL